MTVLRAHDCLVADVLFIAGLLGRRIFILLKDHHEALFGLPLVTVFIIFLCNYLLLGGLNVLLRNHFFFYEVQFFQYFVPKRGGHAITRPV